MSDEDENVDYDYGEDEDEGDHDDNDEDDERDEDDEHDSCYRKNSVKYVPISHIALKCRNRGECLKTICNSTEQPSDRQHRNHPVNRSPLPRSKF